ncbi:B12-binding domain-containing radical SAM protein [Planctomycetota bacterium]
MLTLINTNRMSPPVGPIGLDYIASSLQKAGMDVEILDLCLVEKPGEVMTEYFSGRSPELVGVTFRNSDDCFWPSADWFVPDFKEILTRIRSLTDAPVVIGGVGFSIFPEAIFDYVDVDFGICGDGEDAIAALVRQLRSERKFSDVPGLLWRQNGKVYRNSPSWPEQLSLKTPRNFVDNPAYFKRGGQCGLETKRGCNRNCLYCADPQAKGNTLRLRNPSEIADEVESLLARGIDVLHICDSEFNLSRDHAYQICKEFNARSLGEKLRWYTYMSPVPFDSELAGAMAKAGCVGIDFTGDSACESMLKAYQQHHSRDDLADGVKYCRENNMAVMIDLLLGGPGETKQTVTQTIDFIKQINPDCAGAALGMRVYPQTAMEELVAKESGQGKDNLRRKYSGPVNLLRPTFYMSEALGEKPAELVKDLIAGDKRFFEPLSETEFNSAKDGQATDYNYNENTMLTDAIEAGARGAYWHILQQLRN